MKVFVTGATGCVGAHTARALLDAGHAVRLLVRDAEFARRYFSSYGNPVSDLAVGDIRDRAAVRKAMGGCDAVFHAAAAVALDPRKAQETYDNNVGGAKAVIESALDAKIRNIVYVSSLSVLFQPGLPRIDERTPLAACRSAYSRSKRDCDEWVRGLQKQGAPVQVTYPAAVMGPDDPRLCESNYAIVAFLTQMLPRTTTGMQTVDARDLAAAHRFLLENVPTGNFEDARYIVGGHYHRWDELHAQLERVTGRSIAAPRMPGALLRGMGALTDFAQKLVPFETHMSEEAMTYVTQWSPADSSKISAKAGVQFRSGEETFTDTIRWLAAAGHLSACHAGRLAA